MNVWQEGDGPLSGEEAAELREKAGRRGRLQPDLGQLYRDRATGRVYEVVGLWAAPTCVLADREAAEAEERTLVIDSPLFQEGYELVPQPEPTTTTEEAP